MAREQTPAFTIVEAQFKSGRAALCMQTDVSASMIYGASLT